MMNDTRTYLHKFNDRWLFEMPRRTGYEGSPLDYYNIASLIDELKRTGFTVKDYGNDLYGLNTGETNFFWIGENMQIVTELHRFERALAVSVTAKNPEVATGYHASDLYEKILHNTDIPLLFSGEQMSRNGEGIWRWLMQHRNVLAYKPGDPKHFKKLTNMNDFEELMGDTEEFTEYRFILSPTEKTLMENYASFEMMRIYQNVHGIF